MKRIKENKLDRLWIILPLILVVSITIVVSNNLKLENKTVSEEKSFTKYKSIKEQIEDKINSKKLDNKKSNKSRIISLEKKYQPEERTTGRHPFMPPGVMPGVAMPTGVAPVVKVPDVEKARPILPSPLEPLPEQKEVEIEIPEVPAWPTKSPVLVAGPPQRLQSLLNLKVTGIAGYGNNRFAIIEELVSEQKGIGREATGKIATRSYIVKEGSTITEYRLRVKKITDNKVELQRGNQRIELALVYEPETLPLPVGWGHPIYGTRPASEARYKGIEAPSGEVVEKE